MKKLRQGDTVVVIAGKHKGKVSTITGFDTLSAHHGGTSYVRSVVYLKDVNTYQKSKKKEGFVTVTLPLDISNVAYYDAETKKSTKIGIKITQEGKKVRYKKSDNSLLA